jgi:hypothetical protein
LRFIQENEMFKQDVKDELQELRQLIATNHSTPIPAPSPLSTTIPTRVDTTVTSPSLNTSSTTNIATSAAQPNLDVQTQTMLMLTESFSKLSTVLQDKTSDSKIDWPKFSGDSKRFQTWYLSIMTQISMPPWRDLYDPITHDIVLHTDNVSLNGKLYAKVLASLEGQALQNVIVRKHLRANGLMLLKELV